MYHHTSNHPCSGTEPDKPVQGCQLLFTNSLATFICQQPNESPPAPDLVQLESLYTCLHTTFIEKH